MSLPVHNFLKTFVEALRNDVPRRDYTRLSKNAVNHARRDLMKLLEAIPGANFQNVKLLRAQLNIADHGYWSQFNLDTIEDAALEYYVLVKVGTETKTDTTELSTEQKEKQEKTGTDNEDVPMPTIRHVDTAELLRRSKEAGDKLIDGNSSIADLNDPNRPTKLAEMFTQLYDNEWTDAFAVLTKENVPERQAIEKLLGNLEAAFKNCKNEVEQKKLQLKETQSEQSDTDNLKNVTDEQINTLQQNIGDKVIGDSKNQVVRIYIDECIRLSYLMNVQNPPMVLLRQEPGTKFNSSHFKEYQKTGESVEYLVWPALLLHENGPVAAKGVVQLQ
ncbi:hypothetical protein KUTeg_024722 [Tegillarca granosa]|uniref:Mitochondria-eating protein n=1 Tax=Tegillarca granosa TaxID=220873 RepID=A0ABQ9DY62_TEGGR|nr:hypothetical protein KUTeg_024722 [Tegillarca granosa]